MRVCVEGGKGPKPTDGPKRPGSKNNVYHFMHKFDRILFRCFIVNMVHNYSS